MKIYRIAFAALLPLAAIQADDAPARARLIGVWQQQDDSGKVLSVWVLETKGTSLHITNSQGDQKLSEIECKPTGAECLLARDRDHASIRHRGAARRAAPR